MNTEIKRKPGRPPINDQAMTGAEREAKRRERIRREEAEAERLVREKLTRRKAIETATLKQLGIWIDKHRSEMFYPAIQASQASGAEEEQIISETISGFIRMLERPYY